MTTAYQRIPLSERIGFSEILDTKLKTNTLKICLFQPLSAETASACALAGDLATSSNAKYPSNQQMNQKLHLLYGADLGSSVSRQGDLQMVTIHASAIDDRYTLENEPIFAELTEILLDCLRVPNVTNDAFDAQEFQIKQKELLDNIDAEINEKRVYAIQQASKIAYQNEPAARSSYGSREEALALTPKSAYAAFRKMLREARIEIFFVGSQKRPELPEKLKTTFDAFGSVTTAPLVFYAPSSKKAEPAYVNEVLPVNQSKLVMIWKTDCTDRYAVKMMTLLLGGTSSSKLFANVREKMSLCYYCAANYTELKQALQVDSGVETANLEKTQTAITAQLDAIANGEVSDVELQSAWMFVHNSLKSIGDTASSYISWYLGQLFRDTNLTPTKEEALYLQVTKEQIVAAAKSMQLDTVYTLRTPEQED
ncbi:MAG: insulinase family protein [Ruminococcus sp.]|nr:insulinase family protein [Ruminococcus sp.]